MVRVKCKRCTELSVHNYRRFFFLFLFWQNMSDVRQNQIAIKSINNFSNMSLLYGGMNRLFNNMCCKLFSQNLAQKGRESAYFTDFTPMFQ